MEPTRGWVHLPSASPGPPGPVPRAPASRRPHPLPPWTAPPAGLLNPTRPARQLPPLVPPGVPFRTPCSLSSCARLPSIPRTPPRPACSLSAPPSCLLPQASFHPRGTPTFTLSFPTVFSHVCALTGGHTHTRSHLPTHTYHLRMNTDTHILLHTHVYTIPGRHTNTHSYVLMHTHKHSHTGTCRHTLIHTLRYSHIPYTHGHRHTNTQTHTFTHTHMEIHMPSHTHKHSHPHTLWFWRSGASGHRLCCHGGGQVAQGSRQPLSWGINKREGSRGQGERVLSVCLLLPHFPAHLTQRKTHNRFFRIY